MDYRRKVYHRNGNNEDRAKQIRESIRVRSASKKLSESVKNKSERFREREDVQNFIKKANDIAGGDYDEKCAFLNTVNRLLLETKLEVFTETNIFEDLCSLVLIFLKDDHPCIRAMCFHIIRKSLFLERHLVYLLRSHVDIYMVRAVDLQIENEQERVEAFKLITWMMNTYDGSKLQMMIDDAKMQANGKKYAFPKSIMQPIISIALDVFQKEKLKGEDDSTKKNEPVDRMSMPCVGLFLEFCLSEPDLILEMAGTDWMVRVLTGVSTLSRRIVLLVSQVLVFWLDNPHIRQKADLHMVLEQIFAPLVEYGLFQKKDNMQIKKVDDNVYDVLENFKASFMVLLRSWPGLFACAAVGPNSSIIGTSPLRLLEYLGLGTVENENLVRIREIIVEMCCEFGDLPYSSKNFESWDEALVFYKSMHLPDKYKSSLKNDFVVAQNDARMRNDVDRKKPTFDIHAAFRCLSTFVLINASLPQSLARLILAQPDSSSGLKATLLLADMLRNAPSHVPVGYRAPVLSMPTLVQSACENLIQSRASAAINGNFDIKADESYTFINAQNAELVLHRFDQLNQSWIRSSTNSATIMRESDLHIFVQNMQPPLIVTQPKEKSKRPTVTDIFEEVSPGKLTETVLEGPYDKNKLILMDDFDDYDYTRKRGLSFDSMDSNSTSDLQEQDGSINWNQTEYFIEKLENDTNEEIVKEFQTYSTQQFVSNLIYYISPPTKKYLEKQHVIVTKSLIRLILRIIPRFSDGLRHDYCAIFHRYVQSFRTALEDSTVFSPRNLTYTTNMYHFAIVGSFTISSIGLGILNDVGILHL
ncbi:unnamed protein product [Caenorhabditis angaria]|uniref:Rapamycin-insensitive companion of mTOR N-terminal domain-containing protein n=1 Tax=Caenorhabditis angaria TaxID=860376 RepID=A0A9P1IA50_9PELO|nr:unnamed protein product [Caenorhabditis angaria]